VVNYIQGNLRKRIVNLIQRTFKYITEASCQYFAESLVKNDRVRRLVLRHVLMICSGKKLSLLRYQNILNLYANASTTGHALETLYLVLLLLLDAISVDILSPMPLFTALADLACYI